MTYWCTDHQQTEKDGKHVPVIDIERERDELREANQAQRNQIAVTNVELAESMKKADELRAEVERLTEAHRYCDETIRKHQQSWAAEHAENERLRAELAARPTPYQASGGPLSHENYGVSQ